MFSETTEALNAARALVKHLDTKGYPSAAAVQFGKSVAEKLAALDAATKDSSSSGRVSDTREDSGQVDKGEALIPSGPPPSVLEHRPDETGPGFAPGPGVDGKPKPYFKEGTKVLYNLGDGLPCGLGKVVGLASQNVIDMWIVQILSRDNWGPEAHPWSCLLVPHYGLKEV